MPQATAGGTSIVISQKIQTNPLAEHSKAISYFHFLNLNTWLILQHTRSNCTFFLPIIGIEQFQKLFRIIKILQHKSTVPQQGWWVYERWTYHRLRPLCLQKYVCVPSPADYYQHQPEIQWVHQQIDELWRYPILKFLKEKLIQSYLSKAVKVTVH